MRQNAPNPVSISIFSGGNTPGPPPVEALPQTLGGEGGKGKGRERERGGEGKMKEG